MSRRTGQAVAAEPEGGTVERFERYWARVIDSIATNRQIWAATFEVFGQIDRVPDIRCAIADALQGGRLAWASLLQGIDAAVDPKQAQAVGSFYQALLTGVPMQGSVDPERPRQLVTSLTR